MFWLGFAVGIVIGIGVTVFALGLCEKAGDSDRCLECKRRRLEEQVVA